jgi:hypothetical protein
VQQLIRRRLPDELWQHLRCGPRPSDILRRPFRIILIRTRYSVIPLSCYTVSPLCGSPCGS